MPLPIPPESDRDRIAHERAWLEHVRAGRIGGAPALSAERLLNHLNNEEVLLGKARAVRLGQVGAPWRCVL